MLSVVSEGRQKECFSPQFARRRVFTQPGSKAALTVPKSDFGFTPESGLNSDIAPCPKGANSGNEAAYSIT